MDHDETESLVLGMILIAIAGSVDAIGFLHSGTVFVSFVSGDSTRFWVAASTADWAKAIAPGVIIVIFLVGAILGHLVAAAARAWRRTAVLLTVAVLLSVAMVLQGQEQWLIVPLALAMGAQNAVVHHAGHMRVAVTYVTGTIVSLGATLAETITGRSSDRWAWVRYLLFWVSLSLGAVAGASLYRAAKLDALSLPLGAAILTAAFEAARQWRRRRNATWAGAGKGQL